MATTGGAAAAGDRDGLGRIEPGRRADLVLLDLDTIPFTPLNDPLHQAVFGSTTLAVDSTMIGGRRTLRRRKVTRLREAPSLAAARRPQPERPARRDAGLPIVRPRRRSA